MLAVMTIRGGSSAGDWVPLSERSDLQLLREEGEPAEAFAVFYRRHVDSLIRFSASRGLDADGAADVVSDTFLAALRGRHGYRPEREDARLWLLAIASRRIADVHRGRGSAKRREGRLRTEAIVLTQVDRDSYLRLIDLEDEHALDALSDLPVAQQRILRARIIDDREYADIARSLGLSEAATRQHVSRGLAALRRMLKDKR